MIVENRMMACRQQWQLWCTRARRWAALVNIETDGDFRCRSHDGLSRAMTSDGMFWSWIAATDGAMESRSHAWFSTAVNIGVMHSGPLLDFVYAYRDGFVVVADQMLVLLTARDVHCVMHSVPILDRCYEYRDWALGDADQI